MKTASKYNVALGGETVTYTYKVTNLNAKTGYGNYYDSPRYIYPTLSDDKCANMTYVSGQTTDRDGDYGVAPGDTATYTCTMPVTQTTTNTVTATVVNYYYDPLATTRATATVVAGSGGGTGDGVCNTLWYSSYESTSSVGSVNGAGAIGQISTTGTITQYFDIYTDGPTNYDQSAAVAIDPTNPTYVYYVEGMSSDRTYDGALMRYNTTTDSVSQVTAGASTPNLVRLAADPSGNLWGVDGSGTIWMLTKGTTTWTNKGTLWIPTSATDTTADTAFTYGSGDIAFDGLGNMWVIGSSNSTAYLFTVSAAQLAGTDGADAVWVGNMGSGEFNGIAFGADGTLYATTGNAAQPALYTVNKSDGSTSWIRNLTDNTTDLASCALPKPELRITKVANSGTVAAGGLVTYTVKIENIGTLAATGVTFLDNTVTGGTYQSSKLNTVSVGTAGVNYWSTARPVNSPGQLSGQIAPGEAATIEITVKAGTAAGSKVCNQGKAGWVGAPPNGQLTDDPSTNTSLDPTCVEVLQPGINVDKKILDPATNTQVDGPLSITGSQPITYFYYVTNTGNEPLKTVTLADDKCPNPQLQPANTTEGSGDLDGDALLDLKETWVYKCTSTISATTTNIATARGAGNTTGTAVTDTDQATVNFSAPPGIDLTKTAGAVSDANQAKDADGTGGVGHLSAGDKIAYTFTVKTTSATPLSNVTVTDAKCDAGTLARTGGDTNGDNILQSTETWTYTCTYTLKAADLASPFTVNNTANASGTHNGTTVTDTASATKPLSAIDLTKTAGAVVNANGNGHTGDKGDTITFSFVVKNTGNTTLTNITVNDPMLGGAITCPQTTLAAGASMTCTSVVYTLTQADVDAGAVANTAIATGTGIDGLLVDDPGSTATPLTPAPKLTLDKTSAVPTDVNANGTKGDAGDTIAYTFAIKNDGNVTMTGVTITDNKLGWTDATVNSSICSSIVLTSATGATTNVTSTWTATSSLAPGETLTCVSAKPYVITAADVTSGSVVNVAHAEGDAPKTPDVPSNEDSTTTPLPKPANITLDKTSSAPSVVSADGTFTITYTIVVANTGGTNGSYGPLTDTLQWDPQLIPVSARWSGQATGTTTFTGAPYAINLTSGTTALAAGAQHTYVVTVTGKYTTSATESVCAGPGTGLFNTAATGTLTDTACENPPAPKTSAIDLIKTMTQWTDVNGNGLRDAGDTLAYSFTVTNTGGLTLTGVTVTDPKVGTVTCPKTTLLPGESMACTAAAYTITAADVTAGSVPNTATATGTDPNGGKPSDKDSTNTPLQTASIDLVKSHAAPVDVNSNGMTDAGDTVKYSFVVTNTGTTTLNNVTVTDPKIGAIITCPATTLAPQGTMTCTATYTLTQGDIQTKGFTNIATATGTPQGPNGPGTPVKDTDDDVITIPSAPKIELDKISSGIQDVATPAGPSTGDTITYTFRVKNTGNNILWDIYITDTKLGYTSANPLFCAAGPLAPGAEVQCSTTVVYRLTDADIAAGGVTNVAVVTGDDRDPSTTNPTDDDTTVDGVTLTSSIRLDKVATPTTGLTVGDEVTYTFTVTNTSNVTLTNVKVTDPMFTTITCPKTTLAAGESMTCTTAPYVVKQADVDAGTIVNTATASGTDPKGGTPTSTDTEIVTPAQSTAITLDKSHGAPVDVNKDGAIGTGDTITYSFVVKNTGTVTLTGVTVTDEKLAKAGVAITCPKTTLAPGESMTCTSGAYTITDADVMAGKAVNTATTTGTPPGTLTPPTDDDTDEQPLTPAPALSLDKIATPKTFTAVGDVISYTFVVKNTGNVTLTNVVINDPKLGITDGACVATLAPGATATCTVTGTHTISQDDMNAGRYDNTATATGDDPNGTDVPSNPDTEIVTGTQAPALTIVKTHQTPTDVNGNELTDAGDTVVYEFRVTNTGNVTLDGIRVDDPKLAAAGVAITCTDTVLAPGASTTCTSAPYTITEADQTAGGVHNTATAIGDTPGDTPVESPEDPDDVPTTTPAPSLALVKTVTDASGDNIAQVGEVVTYTFTVTNTGNVTMSNITVTDTFTQGGPGTTPITLTCTPGTIAPNEQSVCTYQYTVTQADADLSKITNIATAKGTDPEGTEVPSNPDDAEIPTPVAAPSISLVKVVTPDSYVDVTGDGIANAGDTISYTFTVVNNGNVTLSNVKVTDAKLAAAGVTITCPKTTLAPGDSMECTSSAYTITAADQGALNVHNVAAVTGNPPAGDPVGDNDTEDYPLTDPKPGLTLNKVSVLNDGNANGTADAGETITYTFVVSNTGNTILAPVTITDPMFGLVAAPCVDVLQPGETLTCTTTRTYTVTADDVASGQDIVNTATAHGDNPGGTDPQDPSDTEETPVTPDPKLTLDKKTVSVVDVNKDGLIGQDDTISYQFVVTNTGNVNLVDVVVTDPKLGVTIPVGNLAIGQSVTVPANPIVYTITSADVTAGSVLNTATVTGENEDPTGPDPQDETDTEETPVTPQNPALSLDKQVADASGDGIAQAGELLTYTFVVTNTGNVTISDITVTDTFTSGGTGAQSAITCEATTLAAGESTTCTMTYTVTELDVMVGTIANTATADGTDPDGDPVPSNPDDETIKTTDATPALTLDKKIATVTDVNGNGITDAGDTVVYTYDVTNSGNVTITNLVVTDDKVGVKACAATTLPVGQSTTCESQVYTITAADVAAGQVVNVAIAHGDDPQGGDVPSNEDTETVPVTTPAPGITLVKKSTLADTNGNGTADAGEIITYTFTVTNTGNTVLAPVTISDPLLGLTDAPCVDRLEIGATATCTSSGSYTVKQADVDKGLPVINTAVATGTVPGDPDNPVTDDDTEETPVTPEPAIDLVKKAVLGDTNGNGKGDLNETITFSFVVTNTGNMPLTDVTVTDPMLASAGIAITCPKTTLAVGETMTCTAAPYTITQADVDAGRVANVATATGDDGNPDIPNPEDPGDTETPTNPINAIDLVKKAGAIVDTDVPANGSDAGDQITYTFVVTNTGTTTLTDITVTDPMLAAQGITITCPKTTLVPGEDMTCTASGPYTLTQEDIDAGHVANTATVIGTPPSGDKPTDDGSTDTPIDNLAAITIDKKHNDGDPVLVDGDYQVTYSFVVKNVSNVTLTDVTVTDPKLAAAGITITCPKTTLVPGEEMTCAASGPYTLTQAEIDGGMAENIATVNATDPKGNPVTDDDPDTVTVTPTGAIQLDKSGSAITDANGDGKHSAGDTMTFTFVVKNTGNVTLTGVTVTDPMLATAGVTITCPATTLAPNASMTCTSSEYTLTQGDVDAGKVYNQALATGTTPGGENPQDPGDSTTPVTPAPGIGLTKTAGNITDVDGSGTPTPGDTISYTFTVTNTGNVTLAPVTITDAKLGLDNAPCVASLAPGDTATCSTTGSYTLTQADIDAGEVANTAIATGTPPSVDDDNDPTTPDVPGTPVTDDDTETTEIAEVGQIELVKTAGAISDVDGNGHDAGDEVVYTFTVTNTSNVTLTNVVITDEMLAGAGVTISCPKTTLAAGEKMECTATAYVLTQADIDRGYVDNTAIVTGTTPGGTTVTDTDDEQVIPVAAPAINLVKTASTIVDVDGDGVDSVGDTVTYTFTVTNTGNVTLTNVTIDDAKLGLVDYPCVAELAPGETATCTSPAYALTQADINAGQVVNTALATGTPPGTTTPPTDDDTEETPVTPAPSIDLVKTAGAITDLDGNGHDEGDTMVFSFVVTNTGNVTLTDVTVTDPMLAAADVAIICEWPNPATPGVLNPGESATCTSGTYALTQADIDTIDTLTDGTTAPAVINTATATGNPPTGTPVTDDDTTETPPEPKSGILLDKQSAGITNVDGSVDSEGNPTATVGDTISYTFTVTNTGSVTLAPVVINDEKLGLVDFVCAGSLAPGDTVTCTAPDVYALTQVDIDAGSVQNVAWATGTTPGGETPKDDDPTDTPITSVASIDLVKTAGTPTVELGANPDVTDAGDTITYTFTVTNTSNVTLTDIVVSDPMLGEVTCEATTLAPGASTTCTAAPYVLTQADIDATEVDNTAIVTGNTPGGDPVTDTDTETVPTPDVPGIHLVKTAGAVVDADGDGLDSEGDTITYTFTVTNTGNVTLTDVTIDDAKLGLVDYPCAATLAPGETATCTSPAYVLTQDDVTAGEVVNKALATGNPPVNPETPTTPPTDDDDETTPLTPAPAITIVKTVAGAADGGIATIVPAPSAGDEVIYTFVVENTGNLPLTDVSVDDPILGLVDYPCGASTLEPGAESKCTYAYTLTQADIDRGSIHNVAWVEAVTPPVDDDGNPDTPDVTVPVEDDDDADVEYDAVPGITLEKSHSTVTDADNDGIVEVGDTVSYLFTVTNTGNVTLTNVTIDDEKLGLVDHLCVAELAPGASFTCEVENAYTITAADIDAGKVDNVALATGTPPGDITPPTDEDDDTVILPEAGAIELVKTASAITDADKDGTDSVGDTVTYTFEVTNTSNVTLRNIVVTDEMLAAAGVDISCPKTTLAAGESMTCTSGAYALTQANIDAGVVNNVAIVTGETPTGTPVTDTDVEDVPVDQTWGINLVKDHRDVVDVNGNERTDAGDTVVFTFVVKNTGNVTLTDVTVTDPTLAAAGVAITCPKTTLAPGDSMTCTSQPYTITQGDVDAGGIHNVATATGTTPPVDDDNDPETPDVPVTPGDEDEDDVPVVSVPGIDLVKTASAITDVDGDGTVEAGDTMTFTFVVTNTGNVTLTGVTVTDPMLAAAGVAITCPTTVLAPGEAMTCTSGVYALTQGDIDSGAVDNVATATGNPPTGEPVTDEGDTTTPVDALAQIDLDKVAGEIVDVDGNGHDAGDTITYTFVVTNTSNVTLTGIKVTDPMVGAVTCPFTTLEPGASMTCTAAAYTLTQADIDRGYVQNTAVVDGTTPGGDTVTDEDTETVKPEQKAGIELIKSGNGIVDVNGNGIQDAGDTITYTFTVTNTGTVTLAPVTIDDEKLGLVDYLCVGSLAPGETAECDSPAYVLTRADVDAGQVLNTAIATGTPPENPDTPVTPPTDDDDEETPVTPAPGVNLVKDHNEVVDVNTNGMTDAGDTVVFTFVVTNTGNVTLTDVTVTDPMLEALGLAITCPTATLAAGESMTCTSAPYTITQDDVNAGGIHNVATATGTTPPIDDDDNPETPDVPVTPGDDDDDDVPVTDAAGIDLTKDVAEVVDVNNSHTTDAGDTITYTFVVTNTGQATLTDVHIVDPKLEAAGVTITCPQTTLVPGESMACTSAPYTITEADAEAGEAHNVATAIGTTPGGGDVTDEDDATTPVEVGQVTITPTLPTVTETVTPTVPTVTETETVTPTLPTETGGVTPTPTTPTDTGGTDTPLPRTGSDIVPLLAIGAAAVMGGMALLLIGRRRREEEAEH